MADTSDFNSLPDRANKARGAINNLSSAFEDLSKNGGATAKSMGAFAGALGTIPIPAAQVASIGLQIASSFLRAREAAAKLREQQIADEFKKIETAAKEASERVATFRDTMLSGATIEEARLSQEITNINVAYVQLENEVNKRIEGLKKEKEAAENSAVVNGTLEDALAGWSEQGQRAAEVSESITYEQKVLSVALVDARNKVAALKAQLDALHPSSKKTKDDTQDLVDAFASLADVIASVGDSYSYDFPITEVEIETINAFTVAIDEAGQMAEFALGQVGAAAFDRYATAMDRVIDGHNAFSASSGRKFQNASADILRALGRDAAARAVYHLAQAAAGSAGVLNTAIYGTPSENLKAAALFGSVAVMAGVGAGALSVKGGGGGGGNNRPDRSGGNGGGPTINVTILGEPDYEGKQRIAQWIAQVAADGGA